MPRHLIPNPELCRFSFLSPRNINLHVISTEFNCNASITQKAWLHLQHTESDHDREFCLSLANIRQKLFQFHSQTSVDALVLPTLATNVLCDESFA